MLAMVAGMPPGLAHRTHKGTMQLGWTAPQEGCASRASRKQRAPGPTHSLPFGVYKQPKALNWMRYYRANEGLLLLPVNVTPREPTASGEALESGSLFSAPLHGRGGQAAAEKSRAPGRGCATPGRAPRRSPTQSLSTGAPGPPASPG